jgi:hypothetical protein
MALLLLAANIAASAAQELPPGSGPLPPLRRGPDGQIEVVRPAAPAPAATGRRQAAPGPAAPRAAPAQRDGNGAAATAGRTAHGPPHAVITVLPEAPKIPDTTPRGGIVATYRVQMSDGSPFMGNVRFGPPYYNGQGMFALSGNRIIINPDGPGLGTAKAPITHYFTLETVP